MTHHWLRSGCARWHGHEAAVGRIRSTPGSRTGDHGNGAGRKNLGFGQRCSVAGGLEKACCAKVFGMGAAESAIQETPAARMVGGIAIHRPELLSAASRQRIIIWLSTGLLKNPAAPAASARLRILSAGKALMKMIGRP